MYGIGYMVNIRGILRSLLSRIILEGIENKKEEEVYERIELS